MKPAAFSYHRPESVDDALSLLHEHEDATVLAGGQSLLPMMALRLARPTHLIDIGRLEGLEAIHETDGGVSIGSMVTHATAEQDETVARHVPLVTSALPFVGHRAIRNRGTIGGSIAHADPAAELPAVAIAADATIVARSVGGERRIAATDLFAGPLMTTLQDDELLVAIEFPTRTGTGRSRVVELSRRHGDYAMAGLAATIDTDDDGLVQRAALVFFGVAPTPVRLSDVEEALVGHALDDPEVAEEAAAAVRVGLDPPDDTTASAAYRRHVAGVLTRRVLLDEPSTAGSTP